MIEPSINIKKQPKHFQLSSITNSVVNPSPRRDRFRLAAWNCSGIRDKEDRLLRWMAREEVDMCCVTETWLHPDKALPQSCRAISAMCSTLAGNRARGRNGISIIIRESPDMPACLRQPQILAKDNVEGCYLLVKIGSIKILAIYYPPSMQEMVHLDTWLDQLCVNLGINIHDELVILGDFNARLTRWNDTASNRSGNDMLRWISQYDLARADSGSIPTCQTNMGTSIVDHFFSNVDLSQAYVGECIVPGADHLPILCMCPVTATPAAEIIRERMRLRLEKLQDLTLRERISELMEDACVDLKVKIFAASLALPSTIDKQLCIDRLEKNINDRLLAVARSVLGVTHANKKRRQEDLTSPRLERLYLEQSFHFSSEREDEIGHELSILRQKKFQSFANAFDEKPVAELVATVSQISKAGKKRRLGLGNSVECLERYKNHFAEQTRNDLPTAAAQNTLVMTAQRNPEELAQKMFEPALIKTILAKVRCHRAAGLNGLSYDILKGCKRHTLEMLSDFFKLLFAESLVPSSWKRALVVPVPKKGDMSQITNYRPISILEPMRKIYEHCILAFFKTYVKEPSINQGGFRSGHCCNDLILSLNEILRKKRRAPVHVAFLDIKAAYDSVDRKLLWNTCRKSNVDPLVLNALQALFDRNSAQVTVGGRRSVPFAIRDGLLQGSVLSPFLYAMFIDSIVEDLDAGDKIMIGSLKLNCILYADDIAVFAKSAADLKVLLSICEAHAHKNRYRFNVSKCVVLGDADAEYQLEGRVVPVKESFCYLGVDMKRDGIDTAAFVDRRKAMFTESVNRMRALGMNIGGFSIKNSSRLFKIFSRPVLESNMCIMKPTVALSKSLQKSQHQALTAMLGVGIKSSSAIAHALLDAESMESRLKWLRTRYVRRVEGLAKEHILVRCMSAGKNFLSILKRKTFPVDLSNADFMSNEFVTRRNLANESTGGYLDAINRPAFRNLLADASYPDRRLLALWLMKKFPACKPPICSNCCVATATQSHIAECTVMLREHAPNIPARFRPEHLLSTRAIDSSMIGAAIRNAIAACLPYFRSIQ